MEISYFASGAIFAVIAGLIIYSLKRWMSEFFGGFYKKSEWSETRKYLGIQSNQDEIWKLKHSIWDIEKKIESIESKL